MKFTCGYKLNRWQERINHLMYKDDIKLFTKNKKRIGNPITGSENIQSGYRNWIWYRKMCHANYEKRKTTHDEKNRITKSRKKSRDLKKRNITHTWEADTIKQLLKEKMRKEYLWLTRMLLETELYSRNLINGINTKALPHVRFSRQFLKWTGEELP